MKKPLALLSSVETNSTTVFAATPSGCTEACDPCEFLDVKPACVSDELNDPPSNFGYGRLRLREAEAEAEIGGGRTGDGIGVLGR